MKKLALLCVILAVVASGCGKKKLNHQPTESTKTKTQADKKNLALKETEDFFDKSDVSDFAFIDEENEKNTKKPVDNKEKELALAQNDTEAALSQDDEYADDTAEVKGVALKTVYFDLNHNKIRSDQKRVVAEDARIAKNAVKQGKKVVVQGHTCQLGSQSYNMALSQQRAASIKREMVQNGIPEEIIQSVGCGNEMPIVHSDKKDRASLIKDLAQNRRAEVFLS